MCSIKKAFLKISQNSQESICLEVSFLTERLRHRCFPDNFCKTLTHIYFEDHLQTAGSNLNYNVTKMNSHINMFSTVALHNNCSLTNLSKSNSVRLFVNRFILLATKFQHVFTSIVDV